MPWKIDKNWWNKGDDALPSLLAAIEDLKVKAMPLHSKWERHEAMLRTKKGAFTDDDGSLRFNAVRSVRDALKARLSTQKQKVRAKTSGARYVVREMARLTSKFIKGVMNESSAHLVIQNAFQSALDYGIGYSQVEEHSGRIVAANIHPRCVFVDEPEFGNPCLWYKVLDKSKDEITKDFEEFEDEIRSAGIENNAGSGLPKDDDVVTVYEAWYCPPSKEGRHIIALDNVVLFDEEWESDKPGIVPLVIWTPAYGVIGESLPDLLSDRQYEIDFTLLRIQEQMNLGGTIKVFVDSMADLNVKTMTNELVQVFSHNGTKGVPIQFMAMPSVGPEYWAHVNNLIGQCYQEVGISELWANAEKPQGANSGRAISELDANQSARFLHIIQRKEQATIDLADSILSLASSINGFKANVSGHEIKFSDIKISRDQFDLEIVGSSAFPDSTAGIVQTIIEEAQEDANTAADKILLLDSLDHEAFLNRELAPKLYICKQVDAMLYDREPQPMDPRCDVQYAVKEATKAWNQAMLRDDEEAQDLLWSYIESARGYADAMRAKQEQEAMLQQQQQQMQKQAQAMGPSQLAAMEQR